jgi:DNA polymerase sigma
LLHVYRYINQFPAVRPLVLLLKYYLAQRSLNDTYTGGVGSFMLTLMVVHVVQQVHAVCSCFVHILTVILLVLAVDGVCCMSVCALARC